MSAADPAAMLGGDPRSIGRADKAVLPIPDDPALRSLLLSVDSTKSLAPVDPRSLRRGGEAIFPILDDTGLRSLPLSVDSTEILAAGCPRPSVAWLNWSL